MGFLDRFRKNNEKSNSEEIKLHVAGATVRHKSPYESLISYSNEVDISQSFREKWVTPFYLELNNRSEEWIEKMIRLKPRITEDIILKNLGDFNWRTRSTGAYFASIKNETKFTEVIGTHLLKSEVCYAGHQYAITLASFNTTEALNFLNKYLDYYLKRTELDFDQTEVMSALKYLDELNGTSFTEQHIDQWNKFCQSKIEGIKKSLERFKNLNVDGMDKAFESQLKFWQSDIDTKAVADAVSVINTIRATV